MTKRTPNASKRSTTTSRTVVSSRTPVTYTRGGAVDQSAPVWKSTAWDVTWTVGDTIDYDVRQNLEPGNDILHYTFEITSTGQFGILPSDLTMVDGIIKGTIAAIQGGSYLLTVEATNPLGGPISSSSDLSVLVVGLEIVAPTLGNPSNLGNVQRGALISVDFSTGLTDDGNPSAIEAMVYSIDASSDNLTGESINSVTGVYTVPAVDSGQALALYNVVVRTTNSADLYDTATFSATIIANTAPAPVLVDFSSGNDGCNAVVIPTWIAGGDTFSVATSDESTKSIDLLGLYLASNGGGAISGVALALGSDPLPTSWSLAPVTGFLTRTATANIVADTVSALSFVATNSAGDSADSPAFGINIWDDTAVIPTITGITAAIDTNTVRVNLSESCYTTAGDAASYIAGHAWTVNGLAKTPTYVSGGGSGQLEFTLDLDGQVFSGANTVGLVFTAASSDLKSSSTDQPVANADKEDIVPVPGTGEVFSDNFESYSGSISLDKWDYIGSSIALETSGGVSNSQYLKCPYIAKSTAEYTVKKDISALDLSEIYVKFDFKQNGTDNGSKFLKLFGKSNEPEGSANTTFGMDYSDNRLSRVSYGPGTTTSNDTQAFVRYDGVNTVDPLVDVVTTSGPFREIDEWHSYQAYMKYNTNDNRDGVYKVWIDGVLRLHVRDVKNRHNSNSREFKSVELAGYTSAVTDPYPAYDLCFDYVVISTEFIT